MSEQHPVTLPVPTTYAEALGLIQATLDICAPMIAPRLDPDTGRRVAWSQGVAPPNIRAIEWVIAMSWQDLDTGRTFLDADNAPSMLQPHVIGLLTMLLDSRRGLA